MSDEFRQIKAVYEGLPPELKDRVFWVKDEYRINPLSFIEGGTDVVVEYQTKEVFGYDKIKFPANYMDAIFEQFFQSRGFQYNTKEEKSIALVSIKQIVKRLFARKYNTKEEYMNAVFEEIWNESSNELPSEALRKFTGTSKISSKIDKEVEADNDSPFSKYHKEIEKKYVSKLRNDKDFKMKLIIITIDLKAGD